MPAHRGGDRGCGDRTLLSRRGRAHASIHPGLGLAPVGRRHGRAGGEGERYGAWRESSGHAASAHQWDRHPACQPPQRLGARPSAPALTPPARPAHGANPASAALRATTGHGLAETGMLSSDLPPSRTWEHTLGYRWGFQLRSLGDSTTGDDTTQRPRRCSCPSAARSRTPYRVACHVDAPPRPPSPGASVPPPPAPTAPAPPPDSPDPTPP